MRLCVGDDWAEDHHDIEIMDEAGTVLATRRLPEGVVGIEQLHKLIGQFVPPDGGVQVQVGIETDRGPWVTALLAAGYVVFAINPLQASRYRGLMWNLGPVKIVLFRWARGAGLFGLLGVRADAGWALRG
jgi:hypothetical protein